jgi:fluoride exporter
MPAWVSRFSAGDQARPVRRLLLRTSAVAALAWILSRTLIEQLSSTRPTGAGALAANGAVSVYLWIAIGSALGGMSRYWCSGVAARLFGETFPWGTLIINIVGSFVIGFFAALTAPDGRVLVSSTTRQFVMVGICGGYTTFSSFSLQTLNLVNNGEWLHAGGNVAFSVTLSLVAVWAGHALAVGLNAGKWA